MSASTMTESSAETQRPARRPLAELMPTGAPLALVVAVGFALLVASFADFGVSGRALVGAILCPVLVLLAAIDIRHRLLPNAIVLPASLVIALVVAASTPGSFLTHLAAGAALGGFFFAFAAFFPGSIGMGDAKLGLLLGVALGTSTLPAVMVAFVGLLLGALVVLARRGFGARKESIPFGPFLALGGILAFFLS